MQSDILSAMMISSKGMQIQGTRIRTITENVANSNTTGNTPGADPYARKTITFKNVLDRELDALIPQVSKIEQNMDVQFPEKFLPDHPAANADGYVKMPNVKTLVEMADIKEAQRSYEANIGMIEQSRSLLNRTIDLLRV